ncbi:MAG: GNAT family N-acetyltransferase [Bacteroidota bacterium]
MPITLRLLTPTDAAGFQALRLKSYQEAPFAFSESYEDEVVKHIDLFAQELNIVGDPPEWFVLGAFDSAGQLAGFVKFRRDRRSKGRHKSMIHAMYVDPVYRNQGIGHQLMQEVLTKAKTLQGLEQVHLWVLHAKTSAADFYAKLGFVSQGIVKKDLKVEGKYVDAEYMVLDFLTAHKTK